MEQAPDHEILLSPAPFAHFTIKEALEQPEAIARALAYGARMDGRKIVLGGLDTNREKLMDVRNMVLTGCGTSKYAAELGAKIMRYVRSAYYLFLFIFLSFLILYSCFVGVDTRFTTSHFLLTDTWIASTRCRLSILPS